MASGDSGNELTPQAPLGESSAAAPTTPKAPEAKQATPLQKWLDGLEGATEADIKASEGPIGHWTTDRTPEENRALDLRLDNTFLKEALPRLLSGMRQPNAVDHPLAYLMELPEFEEPGIGRQAMLAKRVEEAVDQGNLVAVDALLLSRKGYLYETTKLLEYRANLRERAYYGPEMVVEPLTNAEREALERTRRESRDLDRAGRILGDKYGVNSLLSKFGSWENILKAPTGPNPPQPVAKAA